MSYFDSLRTGCADLNIEVKFGDRLFDIKACCAVFDQLQLQGLHFLSSVGQMLLHLFT